MREVKDFIEVYRSCAFLFVACPFCQHEWNELLQANIELDEKLQLLVRHSAQLVTVISHLLANVHESCVKLAQLFFMVLNETDFFSFLSLVAQIFLVIVGNLWEEGPFFVVLVRTFIVFYEEVRPLHIVIHELFVKTKWLRGHMVGPLPKRLLLLLLFFSEQSVCLCDYCLDRIGTPALVRLNLLYDFHDVLTDFEPSLSLSLRLHYSFVHVALGLVNQVDVFGVELLALLLKEEI